MSAKIIDELEKVKTFVQQCKEAKGFDAIGINQSHLANQSYIFSKLKNHANAFDILDVELSYNCEIEKPLLLAAIFFGLHNRYPQECDIQNMIISLKSGWIQATD